MSKPKEIDYVEEQRAFLASVEESRKRIALWPEWKRRAAAATRVSPVPTWLLDESV